VGKAGQGSASTQHRGIVSLFIVVTKYLRKQLKRGRNYFGSRLQRFPSSMAGRVKAWRGSQHGNQEAERENACSQAFSFFLFYSIRDPSLWNDTTAHIQGGSSPLS
jgi:hypothetical protein